MGLDLNNVRDVQKLLKNERKRINYHKGFKRLLKDKTISKVDMW